MKLPVFVLVLVMLLATPTLAQQQPTTPANFDIRLSAALRNDLAGTLIKMSQSGSCDVPCHIIIARALVALDAAAQVEPPKEAQAETPKQ